jgi:Domain of unknown function (DUF1772)
LQDRQGSTSVAPFRAMTARRPLRRRSWWGSAARLGQSAWFFGNLYEAMVGTPQLLADVRSERAPRLLGAGSPVRYYIPVAPLAFGATAVALLESWRSGDDRRLIITSAACTAAAAGLTAYLIRSVNLRLLSSDEPLSQHDRNEMVATWHLTNGIRLGLLAAASTSLSRVLSKRS